MDKDTVLDLIKLDQQPGEDERCMAIDKKRK